MIQVSGLIWRVNATAELLGVYGSWMVGMQPQGNMARNVHVNYVRICWLLQRVESCSHMSDTWCSLNTLPNLFVLALVCRGGQRAENLRGNFWRHLCCAHPGKTFHRESCRGSARSANGKRWCRHTSSMTCDRSCHQNNSHAKEQGTFQSIEEKCVPNT